MDNNLPNPLWKIAPLRLRLAASLVDIAVWWGVIFVLLILFGVQVRAIFSFAVTEISSLLVGVLIIGILFYKIALLVWFGRTPGGALFSLRVLPTSGGKLRWSRAIIRLLVDIFPSSGADELKAIRHPLKQTWHDIFAETVVIQEHKLKAIQKLLVWFSLLVLFPIILVLLIFVTIANSIPRY